MGINNPVIRPVKISDIIIKDEMYLGFYSYDSMGPVRDFFEKTGSLPLILILEKEGKYLLISGGKRLKVFQDKSILEIYAYIYDNINIKELPALFIMENFHRSLNAVEMSKIAQYCIKNNLNVNSFIKSKMDKKIISILSLKILNMSESHKEYLAKHFIPFNDLEILAYLKDFDCLFGIIENMKLNGFKMKEFLNYYYKASLTLDPEKIYNKIVKIKSFEDMMISLRKISDPFLWEKRQFISKLRKDIKRHYGIEIKYDNNFEEEFFNIKMDMRKQDNLKKLADSEKLSKFISNYIKYDTFIKSGNT